MNKKIILVISVVLVLIMVLAVAIFRLFRREVETPPLLAQYLPFLDTYEDAPTFTKTTPDIWNAMVASSRKGDYWSDRVYWLEIGGVATEKGYKLENITLGDAKVVSKLSHEGNKSVEITIHKTPEGIYANNVGLARYIRNKTTLADGVYEFGAWFYVPRGYTPYFVHIGLENHLSWTKPHFMYAGVNPEDSEYVVAYREEGIYKTKSIDTIDFQYDTWFKIWILYDTRNPAKYTAGYKSPTEEKTYNLDVELIGGFEPLSYAGAEGFNIYATFHNLPGRNEQKMYVDDFYTKRIE